MLKKMIRYRLMGKARFQSFFERLNSISLAGMNYGAGDDVHSSGETEVLTYVQRQVRNGSVPIVFDVGASVGEYAREVLSCLGTEVQLYCFEPSKQAYAMLAETLEGRENAALGGLFTLSLQAKTAQPRPRDPLVRRCGRLSMNYPPTASGVLRAFKTVSQIEMF